MKHPILVYGLILLILLILPALFWRCGSSEEKPPEPMSESAPIRSFQTVSAQPGEIAHSIRLTGRVVAQQKVSVVAQVQGMALPTTKSFEEGVEFTRGEVLFALDDTESRHQLAAQKSQFQAALVRAMSDLKLDFPDDFPTWNAYLISIDPAKALPTLPQVGNETLRFYLAANNIFHQFYSIQSQEAVLERFVIRAPFTGVVTQASLDPGGLASPGQPLGELMRTDQFELRTSVSQHDLAALSVNQPLALTASFGNQRWQGEVSRIGKRVDPATQAVPVYVVVRGEGLREGMYLEGILQGKTHTDAMELNKDAVTRRNQVHVIVNGVVTVKDVVPLEFREETVIVAGLAAADQVIVEPVQSPIQGLAAASN